MGRLDSAGGTQGWALAGQGWGPAKGRLGGVAGEWQAGLGGPGTAGKGRKASHMISITCEYFLRAYCVPATGASRGR